MTVSFNKAIVFGGSGFLGQNLVSRLKTGFGGALDIVCVTRADIEERVGEWVEVSDPGRAVVFHCAARRYDASRKQELQPEIFHTNVGLASNVYEFCRFHGIKEVRLLSSIAVYGEGQTFLDDGAPLNGGSPYNLYGWSKRITELQAKIFRDSFGINTITFRLANPYGTFDDVNPRTAHIIPALIARTLGESAPVVIEDSFGAARDFIYVDDVVDVLVKSLSWSGKHETYNLATGRNTSIHGITEKLSELLERNVRFVDTAQPPQPGPRVCRVDRLKADFGVKEFIPVDEGLRRTIDWIKETKR